MRRTRRRAHKRNRKYRSVRRRKKRRSRRKRKKLYRRTPRHRGIHGGRRGVRPIGSARRRLEDSKELYQTQRLRALEQELIAGGVSQSDIDKWGVGRNKSLKELQTEIDNRESILNVEGRTIQRKVIVAEVKIYNQDMSKVLKEVEHITSRGVKSRDTYLREKVGNEDQGDSEEQRALAAAKRGIKEELQNSTGGFPNIFSHFKFLNSSQPTKTVDIKSSHSYPGLMANYTYYKFEAIVGGNITQRDTFNVIERGDGDKLSKTIKWMWVPIEAEQADVERKELTNVTV